MALINCPECGRQVSDSAVACPQCGFGVAQYMERQREIQRIQNEAEQEAYAATKKIMAEKAAEKERLRKEAEERRRKEEERIEQLYVDAVNKYSSVDPDQVLKAKEIFASISNYKDSASYINNCDMRYETVMQEYELKRGEKLLEKKKKLSALKKVLVTCVLFGLILFVITNIGNANKKKVDTTYTTPFVIYKDNAFEPTDRIIEIANDKYEHELPDGASLVCLDYTYNILKKGDKYTSIQFTTDKGMASKTDINSPPGRVYMKTNDDVEEAFAYFLQLFVRDLKYSDALRVAEKRKSELSQKGYFTACGILFQVNNIYKGVTSLYVKEGAIQYMLMDEKDAYVHINNNTSEATLKSREYSQQELKDILEEHYKNDFYEGFEDDNASISTVAIEKNEEKENETNETKSNINAASSKTIEHYCEVDGCTNEGTYKITGLNGTDEYYCFKHYTEMDKTLKSMEQETQSSTKSTHYCESSGCYNEGTHKIMGLNGYYEYYCDKHYKEINDILGRMEQDVGSGSQSKHQCEVGGCSKEGTHSMVGLNGTMEYYCTEHYNEMAEIMQMLTGGS